jgi:hypothetical protein
MKVEIEIPKSIVDKLKIKNLTDDEIICTYQEYIAFMLQSDGFDVEGITEFLFWLEHQDINNFKN